MRRQMKPLHLVVAVAAVIALSSLAGSRGAPVPDDPNAVWVWWCHKSQTTSEEITCQGSPTGRPDKLTPRAR